MAGDQEFHQSWTCLPISSLLAFLGAKFCPDSFPT